MIDASIYSRAPQYQAPDTLNQLAKVLQIQGFQQARAKEQQETESVNALNQLYSSAIGPDGKVNRNALITGAAQRGLGSKIPALQENFAKQDKAEADLKTARTTADKNEFETRTKRLDLFGQTMNFVRQNPTPENATLALDYLVRNQVLDETQANTYRQQIAADPGIIPRLSELAYRSALDAKEQLAKVQTSNIGGQTITQAFDPVTQRAQTVSTVQNTQSPDNAATVAATMRGQNMVDARSREANAQGRIPAGYRAKPDGTLEFIPGGPADPARTGELKLTEDQGKATGWLVQAENAYKNMMAATDPAQGGKKSAAIPGVGDAVAIVPGLGGAGNWLRSENRQKFVQGASSLSEALLRAATGAGVNKDEAAQKVQELTPQWGDSAAVIKQKTDAIPLYIESLKVRAGPGAPRAAGIRANSGGATGSFDASDPLGLRK